MNIGDIIKNSLSYPLSNTKNFIVLGLLILLAELYSVLLSLGVRNSIVTLLIVLTIIISVLRGGYNLRVLGSSIAGSDVLPDFENWKGMFVDGIKLLIVSIIYMIPLIAILVLGGFVMGIIIALSGASGSFGRTMIMFIIAIVGLYTIIIYPVLLMGYANMANNENNLNKAFKFGEIRAKISGLGLGSYVKWYIGTGIIYAIFLIVGGLIPLIFGLEQIRFVGIIINAFIIGPFAILFLMRSTSLMYRSTLEFQDEPELMEYPEAL